MGSASREALAQAAQSFNAIESAEVSSQLLNVAAVLDAEPQLAGVLSDASVAQADKAALVARVFPQLHGTARTVLDTVIASRWPTADEFVNAVEELAVRGAAAGDKSLDSELLSIARVVDSSHELELVLGNKLSAADKKVGSLRAVIGDRVSAKASAIAEHLVAHPRGRRANVALREAAQTAAAQNGNLLALVSVAQPLDSIRADRLRAALSQHLGSAVKLSVEVDPEVLGGIRVQVADEVIDGSVRRRLDDLRLQLAS